MYQVVKRDGSTVDFDISKIAAAMVKAFDAQGRNHHPSVINMLALQVAADFEKKISNGVVSVAFFADPPSFGGCADTDRRFPPRTPHT